MREGSDKDFGSYLKARRAKLDPTAFGFSATRRRTPGLRREEVAQRANISATWYAWLEQGRGGAPSASVLNQLAHALMLTDLEREHLFLLGLGRPPEPSYRPFEGVTPRLQRVLDGFEISPAIIRTATWDVVAWNNAAALVLMDYASLAPKQRNVLRILFTDPQVRAAQENWEEVARFVVGALRADAARAGAVSEVQRLADELCQISSEFEAMWRDKDVQAHGDGVKKLLHPKLGPIAFEFSAFTVEGRPELGMLVYNVVDPQDRERIRSLIDARPG